MCCASLVDVPVRSSGLICVPSRREVEGDLAQITQRRPDGRLTFRRADDQQEAAGARAEQLTAGRSGFERALVPGVDLVRRSHPSATRA